MTVDWFGINALENTFNADTWKTAKNDVVTVTNKVENTVTQGWDDVKDIAAAIESDIKQVPTKIEDGFGYLKTGFQSFEKTVDTDFKIVEQDAKIALDYGERIAKDLFNFMKLAGRSAEWLIENNKVVLMVGGAFIASRVINEIKQVAR